MEQWVRVMIAALSAHMTAPCSVGMTRTFRFGPMVVAMTGRALTSIARSLPLTVEIARRQVPMDRVPARGRAPDRGHPGRVLHRARLKTAQANAGRRLGLEMALVTTVHGARTLVATRFRPTGETARSRAGAGPIAAPTDPVAARAQTPDAAPGKYSTARVHASRKAGLAMATATKVSLACGVLTSTARNSVTTMATALTAGSRVETTMTAAPVMMGRATLTVPQGKL